MSKPKKKTSPRKKIIINKSLSNNKNEQIEEKKVEKANSKLKKKTNKNVFGDQLLSILFKNNNTSNVILSPLSVLIALTICMNGSTKNTLKQMINVLYPNRKNKQLTFKHATNITNQTTNIWKYFDQKYDGKNNKPLIKIINKLYLQRKFKILSKYIRAIEADNIESINFNKKATKTINAWCQKNTNHKIKKIVTDIEMLSEIQLLVVNAIYFKGNFVHKFGKNNTKKNVSFYPNNSTKVEKCKVEMLHSLTQQYFKQKVNGIYDIVKLQYKNSDLSLILVIDNYSSNSTQTLYFQSYHFSKLNFRSKKKLNLFVPKFKYDFKVQLRKELKEMGINDAFDRNGDFSNIAEDGFFVHLSSVIHKVSMEISDEATEIIKSANDSRITTIRFDHPFTFYIYDDKKEIVVFSGVFTGQSP